MNGKVGMFGASCGATTQLMAAPLHIIFVPSVSVRGETLFGVLWRHLRAHNIPR